MGKTTTFGGRIRSKGGGKLATPAPTLNTVVFTTSAITSSDTTATPVRVGFSGTSGEYLYLPKGAMVVSLTHLNVATGGTSPTIDIGIDGDDDEIYPSYPVLAATTGAQAAPLYTADHAVAKATGGLAAESRVTANVGGTGTPFTSGSVTFQMTYYVYDDGKTESSL